MKINLKDKTQSCIEFHSFMPFLFIEYLKMNKHIRGAAKG